jgi:ubiquinone biosynthesis accessory factor UbiJ
MQYFVLEHALNFLIQNGEVDIEPLDKKIINFSLQDLPLEVNFVCTNNRIFVLNDTTHPSDVDIKLKSDVFFALFKGEDLTKLIKQDKIIIHGDVKTAQLLVELLKQVDIDLEEILSQYTGDIIAHEVGKISTKFKKIIQHSNNPLDAIKDGLSHFLIKPNVSQRYKNKHH